MAIAILAATGSLRAECDVRPGDRLLLISTRPAGCSTDGERLGQKSTVAEFTGSGCGGSAWRTGPMGSVLGSLDPTTPVVIFVHGNQIEADAAHRRGRDVYRRFVRCAEDDRPVQFVVFSWCSGKVKGLLRDYRVKAARTRPVAWQLAWAINRLPAGAPVGLIGYSYGARVSSGAAHLLAGGTLGGLAVDEAACEDCAARPMRAVFMAAAYDACWLAPGRYHGAAMQKIDSLLTTVNPHDPAMKFYKWVPRQADPPALGGVGPRGLGSDAAPRVATLRVSNSVGRSHDLYRYLSAPGLMRSAWRRLMFADQTAPTVAEAASESATLAKQ